MNQTSSASSTTPKTASTPTLSELERDRAAGGGEYELPRDEDGLFVCIYQNCEAPIRAAERSEAAFFAHLAAHDARNDRLLVGVVGRANSAHLNASLALAASDASTLASVPRAPSPPFTVARRRAQVAAARAAGVDLPPLPHRSRFSLASPHSLPAPTASHAHSPALAHRVQSAPSAHRASSSASAFPSPHSLLDDDAASAAAKKSRRIDVTLHGYDLPILKQVGDGERIQLKCPLGNCPKVIQGFIYHLHSHLMAHRRAEGKGEPLVIRKDRQLDVKAKALAARAAAAANAASTPTAPSTLALRRSASDDNHQPTHNATTTTNTPAAAAAARASAALAIKSTLLSNASAPTPAALAPRLHAAAATNGSAPDDDDDHVPRGDRRHHAIPANVANDDDDDDDDDDADDDDDVDATAPTASRSHAETDNDTTTTTTATTATTNNDDDYDRDDRDESDDDDGGDEEASVAAARRRVATLKRKAPSSASPGVSHVTPDTVLIFCDDPRWRPLSERADLLREFIGKYGVGLFRQNLSGDFLCFFRGCGAMMLQNFSRHLTRHERDSTPIDPALQLVADEFHRQRGSSLLPDGS